jgi:hypothetical protein
MERYIGPLVSLLISLGMFAYGFGRLSKSLEVNTKDIDETKRGVDAHTRQTEIHIDPQRDRETQRVVVDRLARVETTLENFAAEVRSQHRAVAEQQAQLLAEVRGALGAIRK